MDDCEVQSAVAEILEIAPEQLTEETELESFETYDSTARLTLMVALSDLSGREYSLAALQELRTFGDILALVKESTVNGQGS
jgi:acyl carrier protein